MLPCTAMAADENMDGYDDNDFNKIKAFLNQTSSNGVDKNGVVISSTYNDADPTTWAGVVWTNDEAKRIREINWSLQNVAGSLDLSNFSALERISCFGCSISEVNLSGALALKNIDFYSNNLTELTVYSNPEYIDCGCNNIKSLNLNGKTELKTLYCDYNNMSSLDIGGCTNLEVLYCSGNQLAGTLDVSGFEKLYTLCCNSNSFTSLILSDYYYDYLYTKNNKIKSITTGMFAEDQRFTANGEGYICLNMDVDYYEIYLDAEANANSLFYNWTSGDMGISKSPIHYINPDNPEQINLTANFKPGLIADPSDGIIYTGGRVSISPLFTGGEWQYDNKYLQADFSNTNKPVFKGLKPGVTRVYYTVNPGYVYETPPEYPEQATKAAESSSGWPTNQKSVRPLERPQRGGADKMSLLSEGDEEENEDTVTVALDVTVKNALLPVTGQNFSAAIILALTALMSAIAMLMLKRKINARKY